MNFGEEGIRLIILYQETLDISLEEAVIIVMKNKTAQLLLKEELALGITGDEKNLSALMGITLLRSPYDFETLRTEEIKLVRDYYKINIGKDNCLSTSKNIDSVKHQFYNNKNKLAETYIRFLDSKNKIAKIRKFPIDPNNRSLKAATLHNNISIKKC